MGGPSQVNVEYFFRLLYDCFKGACYGSSGTGFSAIAAFAAHLWAVVSIIAYIVAMVALGIIVYCLIRLFELREREEHAYGEVHLAHEEGPLNPRWAHIQGLMGSDNPNDWRQAIIEADIMLDDMLTVQGYSGATLGDKLKQVRPEDLDSLHDAWQAHDVRNQIAHQGSAYDFSETLARRTIARYEQVFDEFQAI
jgi:hypothetical protein